MIWVDRLVKKIKEKKSSYEWVDDMKTPSGRIHVGSLRGVIIHDLVYKALKENDINAHFSYVFNDMDPMDAIPSYLNFDKWEKYAGMPLYKISSPKLGYSSFASFYAQEFIQVFNKLNCHPKIIWSSELYKSGKMDETVRKILNNNDKVREIYKKIAKAEKPNNWYPYQVICEKCGKIGTTQVNNWDGRYVYYQCLTHYVAWAKGCGYQGKVEPKGDKGKLVWKVDWPVHWKVIGVTIESSGKDHMSSGGSYEVASYIVKEILRMNPPESFGGYEWFTVGGRKMSSSKGIGASAYEVSQILPNVVFRFFMVRTPIHSHIDFSPDKENLLKIFDDYDRCAKAFFDKIEKKIPRGKEGEVLLDFARIFELSLIGDLPRKRLFLPRMKTIYNFLLNNKSGSFIFDYFQKQIGRSLIKEEKIILEERINYAKKYQKEYTISDNQTISQENNEKITLNDNQKNFLYLFFGFLKKQKKIEKEKITKQIFEMIKENNLKPKESFIALYQSLTGKNFGPKAADLMEQIGLKETLRRIELKIKD